VVEADWHCFLAFLEQLDDSAIAFAIGAGRRLIAAPPKKLVLDGEFYSDQRVKARESEQESIVAAARQEHRRRDGPPLMVRVYWNAFDVVPKSEFGTLVKELAATISDNAPTTDGRRILDTAIDDTIVLPAHVDRDRHLPLR
jgi:hypothetical protein